MKSVKVMKDPLISIVTPVYNASQFLSDTIRTCQDQTYRNWELILIDDASSDDSLNVIENASRKDKRIKLLKQKRNLGAGKTRNAGTEVAEGRYLAFLDADDLWKPDKLSKQVEFLRSNNYAFIYSSYQFAHSSGEPMSSPVKIPKSIVYRQALKNPIIWTSTVMVDLEKIPKKLLMMPDVRRGQDAATWWQILRGMDISAHGLQESLAYYRRTRDTLSSNKLRAARRTWYLYRRVEGLSLARSLTYFPFYAYNAVKKRV